MRKLKLAKGSSTEDVVYLTKEFVEKTPEGLVMDQLIFVASAAAGFVLTHVDIE